MNLFLCANCGKMTSTPAILLEDKDYPFPVQVCSSECAIGWDNFHAMERLGITEETLKQMELPFVAP